MSNHFTYEIDERNLRMQLKDQEVPLSEEAWKRFESFTNSQTVHQQRHGIRKFNLTLNRNIVLPAVFGAVIISFSFLLFNFISIKDPQKTLEQKAEVVKPVITVPAAAAKVQKQNVVVVQTESPVKTETTPVETKPVAEAKPQAFVSQSGMPGDKAEPKRVEQVPAETAASINTAPDNGAQVQTSMVNTEIKAEEVPVKKKRRRHSQVEEQLPAISPSLVSDEQEADVRPN
jgi:hypothetical protein